MALEAIKYQKKVGSLQPRRRGRAQFKEMEGCALLPLSVGR